MAEIVTIHEVGPRDGLQNEPDIVPVSEKLRLINALVDAGLQHLEVGSFVSPQWVPQMADTDEVMRGLPDLPKGQFDVLVPNMRGWKNFDLARQGLERPFGIAVFVSASEGFSRNNLNCSIEESLERTRPVVEAAEAAGIPIRGYVSCVTDCPFDGTIAPAAVARVVDRLRTLSLMPISLGDTIGKGTPDRVAAMLRAVLDVAPSDTLAGHFHDTGGLAWDNIEVSLEHGLRHFDSAAGGLGGCPYAPGAPGNVATEHVVRNLHDLGFQTGVDLEKLEIATSWARAIREDRRR